MVCKNPCSVGEASVEVDRVRAALDLVSEVGKSSCAVDNTSSEVVKFEVGTDVEANAGTPSEILLPTDVAGSVVGSSGMAVTETL